ncbi:MAG: heavy metal translocating P-type ATPase, partial [Myxococcota bacterium]
MSSVSPLLNPPSVVETSASACVHCGLGVPVGRPAESDGTGPFCCDGCATVYRVLHDHGLTSYYQLREQVSGDKVRGAATAHDYREYEDPTFTERYVKGGPEEASIDFYLEGVHCAACLWLVERLPSLTAGVTEARLDFARSVATVRWDPRQVALSQVARSLDRLGYPPHPTQATIVQEARKREDRKYLIRLAAAGACAGNIMLMAFALYSGAFHGMEERFYVFFRWGSMLLALPAVFWAGAPFFRGAWGALRARTAHMDIPIALGISVGFFSGLVNTIRGVGEIYFDSVATLIFLLLLGRGVQKRQQRWAADAAELRHALTPLHARRVDGDSREERVVDIPVMAIATHDLLEVWPGEVFPADGTLASEFAQVDASVLTGESRPVSVEEGERVSAGTVNLSGQVRMRADATGVETRVGQLMAAVDEAARRKAPIVGLADRISGYFVVTVISLAIAVFGFWMWVEPGQAVDRTVALLIVSCPCALGLATPLAIAAALGKAARRGLLIKGGDVFERLAKPCRFVFDKTGTLTEGGFRIIDWHWRDSISKGATATHRAFVASLEAHSKHPVGRALADAEPAFHLEVDHALGAGVEIALATPLGAGDATVAAGRWRVGSPAFAGDEADAWSERLRRATSARGLTPVMVSREGQVVAVIALGDQLRDDAAASVARLKSWGHETAILSGDDPDAVASVAKTLGVDSARGGASPEEKLAAVSASTSGGRPVVMVGDGVNDAAALSAASVGVAVHGGAEASLAAADVFITEAGVAPVLDLVAGARRVLRVVRTNLAFSLVYNVVTVSLAAAGVIGPLGAAALMPLSSLTVVAL